MNCQARLLTALTPQDPDLQQQVTEISFDAWHHSQVRLLLLFKSDQFPF